MAIGKQSNVRLWKLPSHCPHRRQRDDRVAQLSDAKNQNPSRRPFPGAPARARARGRLTKMSFRPFDPGRTRKSSVDLFRPTPQTAICGHLTSDLCPLSSVLCPLVCHQPLAHGNGKSGLRPGQNLSRKFRSRNISQVSFVRRILTRQKRRERAQKIDIDKRNADFDGVRHASPIGVAQQLMPHVPAKLESRNFEPSGFQ